MAPAKAKAAEPEVLPAAHKEADDPNKPLLIEYGGFTYEIPAKAGESLAFRAAIQSQEDTAVVAALLGPAQWKLFLQRHGRDDGIEAMTDFSDAFVKAVGGGNS